MKKAKHTQKTIDDDMDDVPEELEEDIIVEGIHFDQVFMDDPDPEPETTEEITEEDFYHFKDSLPSGNPWDE